ncbi:MAG: hypothetical protein GVY18_03605 [Bacteroidetes bacterium]|nr:hypothetical protein [Bacteroidota bacterium]
MTWSTDLHVEILAIFAEAQQSVDRKHTTSRGDGPRDDDHGGSARARDRERGER